MAKPNKNIQELTKKAKKPRKKRVVVALDNAKQLEIGLPTEKEFYELINSYLLTLINTTDLMEQEAVCNEVVSNLRAGNDCVSVITLNKPYALLVDLAKISTGRG